MAKSPLIALFYASLIHFLAVFLPFSNDYKNLLYSYEPQISPIRYLLIIACCLWVVVTISIVLSVTEHAGFKGVMLLMPVCLGLQWIIPLMQQLAFGEPSGIMTQKDTLLRLAQGCFSTMLLLLISGLLISKKTAAAANTKFKLKYLKLVIMLLVIPVIYTVIHFLMVYFLAWKSDAFRAYYQGGGNSGIMHMIINMLLDAPRYALFALLRGMLSALFSLPLLFLLNGKRAVYIACHTMLCISGALIYLAPNPLMPDSVSMIHFITNAVIAVIFGIASGYLLQTCVETPAIFNAASKTASQTSVSSKSTASSRSRSSTTR